MGAAGQRHASGPTGVLSAARVGNPPIPVFPKGKGAPKFGWPNGLRRGRVAGYPLRSGEFTRAS